MTEEFESLKDSLKQARKEFIEEGHREKADQADQCIASLRDIEEGNTVSLEELKEKRAFNQLFDAHLDDWQRRDWSTSYQFGKIVGAIKALKRIRHDLEREYGWD